MKTVKIDRKAWTRGQYCNEYGHCCAVGFIAKAELKREGVRRPSKTEIEDRAGDIHGYLNGNISDINDSQRGAERQKNLRKVFKENDLKLVFVN